MLQKLQLPKGTHWVPLNAASSPFRVSDSCISATPALRPVLSYFSDQYTDQTWVKSFMDRTHSKAHLGMHSQLEKKRVEDEGAADA